MKKKTGIGSIILAAVFAVFCLLMAFALFVGESDYMLGGEARDVNEYIDDGVAPPKDEHIKVTVDAVLGNYAETKHKINGIIPAGTEQHYIVWLDNSAALSITVKDKNTIEKLNSICEDTWNYIKGTSSTLPDSIVIEGKVETMNSEVEGYYDDYLSDMGFTDSDFPIYYVTVDCTETRLKDWLLVGFCLVACVCCIIGMVSMIKARKREKLAEANRNAAAFANGINMYNANVNMYGSNVNDANMYGDGMNGYRSDMNNANTYGGANGYGTDANGYGGTNDYNNQ